ncbi:MAG: hypothetical protein LAN71_17055 [Acidobacteriia bacterium]|nr:hypothetical protein [Terriglobia bacterium]
MKNKVERTVNIPEHTIEYLYGRLVDIDAWFENPGFFTKEFIRKRVQESLDIMNKYHDDLYGDNDMTAKSFFTV